MAERGFQGSVPGAQREGPSSAERMLEAMQKVFSHDLPNQLVVVQSLISLLGEEESRLGPDGGEHLRRLRQAAGRASDMVHFLKDMARLAKYAETIEEIRLSALTRELQAELDQMYPERDIRIETAWQVATLYAGRRTLHQALIQLLRCGLDHLPNRHMLVRLSSRQEGNAMEVLLDLQAVDGPLLPNPLPARQDRTSPEQRLEFVLARELLSFCGGTLRSCAPPGLTYSFAIGIPKQVQYV